MSLISLSVGSTAEAARIIYPPETQTIIVTKGQNLILECVAGGIPPPRVTWAKDGSNISGYNKTRFLLSNLLIDTISEEDSGTYSCMADNGVGETGAAVILYSVQVFGEYSYSVSSYNYDPENVLVNLISSRPLSTGINFQNFCGCQNPRMVKATDLGATNPELGH